MQKMRKIFLFIAVLLASYFSFSQSLEEFQSRRVHLPNGWSLTPAGKSIQLGDLPLNIAVSPSKKFIAITNNGQSTQSIQLIDVKKEKIVSDEDISAAWYGLKFTADEKRLYVSGGDDNWILQYNIQNKTLVL